MPDGGKQTNTLTPEQKSNWNRFVDFVAMQKMANSPLLDQRNKKVGMMLLNKYNMANPQYQVSPDFIPHVQQDLHDYRDQLVANWKAGKAQVDGVKSEADIMPGLSPVDGWPGSKTLSHKFPVAVVVDPKTNAVVKDYGTDINAFDNRFNK